MRRKNVWSSSAPERITGNEVCYSTFGILKLRNYLEIGHYVKKIALIFSVW